MDKNTKIAIRRLSFAYGSRSVLTDISLTFPENCTIGITGPSGIGKSTFLTTLNRLWENEPAARMTGCVEIKLDGEMQDIYHRTMDISLLRRKVGMVFQTPNPLPMSIYKNISFPLKLSGRLTKQEQAHKVESSLVRAGLWNEVKDRLSDNAMTLSGGQQQRLCIARALVSDPEVLLLDEPTSSLDKAAEAVVEELIHGLKDKQTLVFVSHSEAQVMRLADTVVCFGENRALHA